MQIKKGDLVEVYVPMGEPPYSYEILRVINVDLEEGLAFLEDNTSVGIGYCTLIQGEEA